jgi:RimJ/RimL family protein N-acetyltransferase
MKSFEENVRESIHDFKNCYFENPQKYSIPILFEKETIGRLRPVPTTLKEDAVNDAILQTKWRNMYKDSFFVPPFTATVERTTKWLNETYFYDDTKIIFLIETFDGISIGHCGIENFEFDKKICEAGRSLRGSWGRIEIEKKISILELGHKSKLRWSFDTLKLDKIYARVFANNISALRLSTNCGYYPVERYFIERYDGQREVVRMEVTRNTLKLE